MVSGFSSPVFEFDNNRRYGMVIVNSVWILAKRNKMIFPNYIPFLLSLSNSQTGEAYPDTVHN